MLAGKAHGGHDIPTVPTELNEHRPTVDPTIPDFPRFVATGIRRPHQPATRRIAFKKAQELRPLAATITAWIKVPDEHAAVCQSGWRAHLA